MVVSTFAVRYRGTSLRSSLYRCNIEFGDYCIVTVGGAVVFGQLSFAHSVFNIDCKQRLQSNDD